MTTRDRVNEQGFCYDADVPPSVPAGEPLRTRSQANAESPRQGLRQSCERAIAALRTRLGGS